MADTKTILIVDDDIELSDGLRVVLERQGFRVFQARDGQQGKQMVYQQRPDLVILDMMMPRMGGYPVLEHFKGKADAPPIIMITANEGSRHKAYAEYLGVIDYIRKPFAMERLLEAVERGLKGEARQQPASAGRERVSVPLSPPTPLPPPDREGNKVPQAASVLLARAAVRSKFSSWRGPPRCGFSAAFSPSPAARFMPAITNSLAPRPD